MWRTLILSCAMALSACAADEGPFVEPSILRPVITGRAGGLEGSFVLSLYLSPDASGASDVTLYQLTAAFAGTVSSDVEFPVSIEPGELVRVPLQFQFPGQTCPLAFSGTIYDELKGALTTVSGPSVPCPP